MQKNIQEGKFKDKALFQKQFIFVLGCPRSGTTWIHKMLSEHPDIAYLQTLNELTTFTHYLGHIDEWWNKETFRNTEKKWAQGLPMVWTEDDYIDFVYSFLFRIYSKIEETKPNATHILDKHPGYVLNIDLIKKFFPNAKLVHIVRDGRDVVVSMYSAYKKMGFASDLVSKNINLWKDSLLASRNLQKYSDTVEIKYEDLQHSIKEKFVEVCKICNLNTSDEIIDPIIERNSFGKNMVSWPNEKITKKQREEGDIWKHTLSIREKFYIERLAGDLLKQYGYSKDSTWWYNSLIEKYLFLIKWGFLSVKTRFFASVRFIFFGKI